jgi:chromosome segregation ATPase
MQAEQARLKRELEELRKERDSLKDGQAAAGQRARASSDAAVARSTRERDALEAELNKTRGSMQELITKFRDMGQTLRDVETERTSLKQAYAARNKELETCAAGNDELYKLNDEVLTYFGDQGFWKRAGNLEPFTRLRRVQLDNIIEQYRYRAEDQKISATPEAGAPR